MNTTHCTEAVASNEFPTRQTTRSDEVAPWEGDTSDGPMCCYCGFARVDADGACECLEAKS